jgi:putrescine transport system substrate-binding protein
MKLMSRRSLAAGAAGPGAGRRGLQAQEEEKVLNIYNWSDYIAEDTLKNFEKETGIKVRYDNFDNNEIVHAKLVAGKTGYDIVVPSSNWAKLQIDGGLLAKIDKSKIPNLKNLDPAVQAQLADGPGQRVHGELAVGLHHGGHQRRQGQGRAGQHADAGQRLGPGLQARVHQQAQGCGVSFLDSPSEVVPAALHYLGKPSFSKNPADYTAAAACSSRVRPHITLFSSLGLHQRHGQRLDLPGAGLVGRHQHRAPACHRRQDRPEHPGPDPQDRRPAVLRRDGDPGRRARPGNAHKFINYILRPEVHASLTNKVFYANPTSSRRSSSSPRWRATPPSSCPERPTWPRWCRPTR